MAEIRPQELEKRTRDLYEKGISALERKNYDYAVDLFLSVLKVEPRLLEARKNLRSAEMLRLKGKKKNAFLKAVSGATSLTANIKAQSLVKTGKGPEAVIACEELLKDDPTDINNVKLFAKAAAISDLPEAAVQLLEIASNAHPSDVSLLNILATFYIKMGRTRSARDCFERIC
jgi:tetratricopeptide (TPR) repeat protein